MAHALLLGNTASHNPYPKPSRGMSSLSELPEQSRGGAAPTAEASTHCSISLSAVLLSLCQHSINNHQDNNSWNKWTELKTQEKQSHSWNVRGYNDLGGGKSWLSFRRVPQKRPLQRPQPPLNRRTDSKQSSWWWWGCYGHIAPPHVTLVTPSGWPHWTWTGLVLPGLLHTHSLFRHWRPLTTQKSPLLSNNSPYSHSVSYYLSFRYVQGTRLERERS